MIDTTNIIPQTTTTQQQEKPKIDAEDMQPMKKIKTTTTTTSASEEQQQQQQTIEEKTEPTTTTTTTVINSNKKNEIVVVKEPFVKEMGPPPPNLHKSTPATSSYDLDSRIYEYVKAANPVIPSIGVFILDPKLHEAGETRIIPFNLSKEMGITEYDATSPNLMAHYIRINAGEEIPTSCMATSQAFYIIRGAGESISNGEESLTEVAEPTSLDDSGNSDTTKHGLDKGKITWSKGDLFVIPAMTRASEIVHKATEDTAIYWITDEPLLKYLGVTPCEKKFETTFFCQKKLMDSVEEIKHGPDNEHKNRLGVLLGNKSTDKTGTLTLTHTMWSLLNVLPPKQAQPPHRHNSVALDMAVTCSASGVYTLMGPELGEDGWVKDPVRVDWVEGGVFLTPPGWWHSHHNESTEDAYVLPIQDAGLYTYQRTLDIQFSKAKSLNY